MKTELVQALKTILRLRDQPAEEVFECEFDGAD
jgi:hypothetical protein